MTIESGRITAVCISTRKGERKKSIARARCTQDYGIEGDAHAGPGPRQVSLLAQTDIDTMRTAEFDPQPGDFAENIVVHGDVLRDIVVGDVLEVRDGPVFEVSVIGKKCHNDGCAIKQQTGTCIMPTRGVFVRVVAGGELHAGQSLRRHHTAMTNLPEE